MLNNWGSGDGFFKQFLELCGQPPLKLTARNKFRPPLNHMMSVKFKYCN